MNKISKAIIKIIETLDSKGVNNEYREVIRSTVASAITNDESLNFVVFTCSTINSEYLWSGTPWLYVNTDPKGNNLEPDLPNIAKIISKMRSVYPKIQLKIFIGNTDPYYIYLRQFKGFSESECASLFKKFDERWEVYRGKLEVWAKELVPDLDPEVVSWYRFEKDTEQRDKKSFKVAYERVKESIMSYFTQEQLGWELRKLRTQFGPGRYFEKLEKPDDALLRDWIVGKFAEYAVQAIWIYENIPNAILIQNEKPSDLRSQMYQPLVREKYGKDFPITYFLGVDNAGYR